ncbi:hypothetical protein F5Y18DRAFT_241685 [Xylariaceae sp. FL1019]|nr:hypothetical protein F5Y18DRAFT_241685 [Xylariaceae sp. FL1019]
MSPDCVSVGNMCIGSQLTAYKTPPISRRHRHRRLSHRPRVTGTIGAAASDHNTAEQAEQAEQADQRSQSLALGVSGVRAPSGPSRPAAERTASRRMSRTGRPNHVDSIVATENDEQARRVVDAQTGTDSHHQHHDAHQETSLSNAMLSHFSWDYILAGQDIDDQHGLNSWTNQPRNEEPFHLIGPSELIEKDTNEALELDFQEQLRLDADGRPVDSDGNDCDAPEAKAQSC